jgi:hypothetical protein
MINHINKIKLNSLQTIQETCLFYICFYFSNQTPFYYSFIASKANPEYMKAIAIREALSWINLNGWIHARFE